MTYCAHCGKRLDEVNGFCSSCGANINVMAAPPPVYPWPQRDSGNDLKLILIILAIVILLPFLLSFLMYLMVMGFP